MYGESSGAKFSDSVFGPSQGIRRPNYVIYFLKAMTFRQIQIHKYSLWWSVFRRHKCFWGCMEATPLISLFPLSHLRALQACSKVHSSIRRICRRKKSESLTSPLPFCFQNFHLEPRQKMLKSINPTCVVVFDFDLRHAFLLCQVLNCDLLPFVEQRPVFDSLDRSPQENQKRTF